MYGEVVKKIGSIGTVLLLMCGGHRSYTARELESHYVRCGHRMSAKESGRVFDRINGKYERNPMKGAAEKERRMRCAQKQRDWETRGMYPEVGQVLMERYVGRVREQDGQDGVDTRRCRQEDVE